MNQEQFCTQVTAAKSRLYHISCSYLQGEHDRLDAISETVLKAWQKRASLKDEKRFDTWLIRILIRECINIQRKQKRSFPVAEALEEAFSSEHSNDLQWAVDALPQKLRVVVVMHYLDGYAVDEIAKILRRPRGTVCTHLFKARSMLKNLLEEESE